MRAFVRALYSCERTRTTSITLLDKRAVPVVLLPHQHVDDRYNHRRQKDQQQNRNREQDVSFTSVSRCSRLGAQLIFVTVV